MEEKQEKIVTEETTTEITEEVLDLGVEAPADEITEETKEV